MDKGTDMDKGTNQTASNIIQVIVLWFYQFLSLHIMGHIAGTVGGRITDSLLSQMKL